MNYKKVRNCDCILILNNKLELGLEFGEVIDGRKKFHLISDEDNNPFKLRNRSLPIDFIREEL